MKRIGLMISTLNSGGAERVVSHLTHILSEVYDVHLILFEDTYMEYSCAGKLHNLDVPSKEGGVLQKLILMFRRIQRLKKLIRQEKLDCVVSFLDSPNFVNVLAKVPGCRRVVSVRSYSDLENRKVALGTLVDTGIKYLYRQADCVVTVSKLIEKSFHEHYGIPEEKLQTIYNPYNFEDICKKGEVALSREEQAFYNGKFVFANVGRIMYPKGAWHLVKAFYLVCQQYNQARLVIVGEDFTDGELQTLIENLKIQDKVLLTGRTRNPYQYMKNAQCYVLSSLYEGFPNAMVEAMACGCPIVAADCKSGPREILYQNADLDAVLTKITEADYGILIPELEEEVSWEPDEITQGEQQLAQAMMELIGDPEKQKSFAQKAELRSRAFDYAAAKESFSRVIEG